MKGQALSAIEGLSLTSENYHAAVKILKNRYGKKQLLITSHIDKLMNIAPVTSIREMRKIREIYDIIEIHIRNLNSLEIDTKQYGPVLVSIVMSKLPNEIKLFISRSMPLTEEWDVDVLLINLKQEIESREMCLRMSASNSNNSSNFYENKNDQIEEEQFTGSTLYSGSKTIGISCSYCRRDHPSSKCNVITDINSRKAILRNKAKCFICLKSGYIARNCNSHRCFKCRNRHHISICDKENPAIRHPTPKYNERTPKYNERMPKYNERTPKYNERTPHYNERTPEYQTVNTNFTGITTSVRTNTLLQTARGILCAELGEEKVRILFDSCSQQSFINESLCRKLNLTVLRTEHMIIKAFESNSDEARIIKVVKAKIRSVNTNIWKDVELHVVPKICSSLAHQTIEIAQASYEHLIALKLADSTGGCAELDIDILIGGDYYCDFLVERLYEDMDVQLLWRHYLDGS